MVQIRVRDTESCDEQPFLLWDTIWFQRLDASGGFGDWILAEPGTDPAAQAGGLRARAGLHTATMLCLLTDRRLPPELEGTADDGDPRGWWGDSIRLDDEPDEALGSLLWTLERSALDDGTLARAIAYAEDALAVLREQGAVARTEVEGEIDRTIGLLGLGVRHWDQAGALIYDQRFDVLWRQAVAPSAPMNFGEGQFVRNAVSP